MCPIRDSGRDSASGGGDEVERVASGEDADVAERAEGEQIAVAGGDEGGLRAQGAGEDVIIVGVAHGGLDHGGPRRGGQRAAAGGQNGGTNLDVTLDAIGNVTWKSDVGSFSYHATKRRAVVSAGSHSYGYDANGNMVTRDGSTIGYASYNLPTSIAAGANTSSLSYGAWRNRTKQVAVTSGSTETTIYVAGLLEKVTKGATTEYRHLISGTPGTVALYTRRSSGTNDTYYLHRDHLGSGELITNAAGTQVVKTPTGTGRSAARTSPRSAIPPATGSRTTSTWTASG